MASKLPEPLSPNTRRAATSAPGATPGAEGSLEAMIPATAVPCVQPELRKAISPPGSPVAKLKWGAIPVRLARSGLNQALALSSTGGVCGPDPADATDADTWYADADGDSFGSSRYPLDACDQPSGYVSDSTDCDDTDADINPGATETADGVDEDCDGTVDEGTEYYDDDGDGYKDCQEFIYGMSPKRRAVKDVNNIQGLRIITPVRKK